MGSMDKESYRELLQDLHCDLSNNNVKCMKFLAQPLIKKRLFSNIQDGLTLFEALEDCNMLSVRNLSFLSDLLETVRRFDLQSMVSESLLQSDAESGEESQVCPFRKLLFKLREEIPDDDLTRLRYLCSTISKRTAIDDPLDLFMHMMQECCLSPDRLDFLKKILAKISRMDLYQEIIYFEETVNPQVCGYAGILRQQHSGPVFQEASLESSAYATSLSSSTTVTTQNLKGHFHQQESHVSGQAGGEQIPGTIFQTASIESGAYGSSVSSFVKGMTEDMQDLDEFDSLNASGLESHQPGGAVGPAAAAAAGNGTDYMPSISDKLEYYKMDSVPRGWCLIIDVNTFTFDPSDPQAKKLDDRKGSVQDREGLRATFEYLQFEVKELENPNDKTIAQVFQKVSLTDHSRYDCLVVCILSHGGLGYFYGSNGRKVDENLFSHFFSAQGCPSLAGKPKLFFLSYCRGLYHQPAVMKQPAQRSIVTDSPMVDTSHELVPNEADFLYGYATIPMHVAYRSQSQGTFYIKALTSVFDQYAHRLELQHLMVMVNKEVAERIYKSDTKINKQTPIPQHTLQRLLKFL